MSLDTVKVQRSTDPTAAQRAAANDWLLHALTRPTGCSGKVLGRRRWALGVKQADVARHLLAKVQDASGSRTVRQPTISAIESGEIGMPRGFWRQYVQALDRAVRSQGMVDAIDAQMGAVGAGQRGLAAGREDAA